MKKSLLIILQNLQEDKEVTALRGEEFLTTRVTNEISYIRNVLQIDVRTEHIKTKETWYGSYKLVRTKENLARTKKVLESHTKTHEDEKSIV